MLAVKEKRKLKQNPAYKELLSQNTKFRNIHSGKRCFILGNGPSLKDIDFSQLKNEITFTCNQLPRNPKFPLLNTNYHAWVDERFFNLDPGRDEDMELVEVMKTVRNSGNNPIVFYKVTALEMVKKFHLDDELNISYIADAFIADKADALKKSISPEHYMPIFSTVVQYLICMAVYMGINEIYLLGCDCTGIVSIAQAKMNKAEESKYSYAISDNEKKRMERVNSETTFEEEMKAYLDLLETYRILHNYCVMNGVKLYNASSVTLLESIPRIRLEDVLKKEP